jgi:site-specific DNA recombinase
MLADALKPNPGGPNVMDDITRVALYARVSSEKQADELTIRSQVAALRERIAADGCRIDAEFCFLDEGVSGATLQRPALEHLRDLAYSGVIDRLYVHSPDRLARNYTYQVVLLEELQKHRVEVVFLNAVAGAAMSDSPEGNMLVQMQGMIAEYERAKILERTRRGRRFSARQGKVSALGHAPYGYRYVSKHEGGGEARYEILPEQGRMVQALFQWVGVEGLSLGEARQRLRQQGVPTPTGQAVWDRSSLRALFLNPAYQGTARWGKTRLVPRKNEIRGRRDRPLANRDRPMTRTSDKVATPTRFEEQEAISVPALISSELFEAVAEKLAENRRRYRAQKKGTEFLLSGLLVCASCGSAYCGRRHRMKTARTGPIREYVYYRCLGTDAARHGGEAICKNACVPARVEEAVWSDLCSLLREPERLRREFEQRLERSSHETEETKRLEKSIANQKRRVARLLDAYENGWIDKSEFEPRIRLAKEGLTREEAALRAHQKAPLDKEGLRLVIGNFEAFAAQMSAQLDVLDFTKKRKVLQLLIKRIEVNRDAFRVVYKVSLRPFAKSPGNGAVLHDCLMFLLSAQAAGLIVTHNFSLLPGQTCPTRLRSRAFFVGLSTSSVVPEVHRSCD